MRFERLLAKSESRQRRPQTIRAAQGHVLNAAETLVKATGKTQLTGLGLSESWLDRFESEIKIASLLHDIGKANDHFREWFKGNGERTNRKVYATRPYPS